MKHQNDDGLSFDDAFRRDLARRIAADLFEQHNIPGSEPFVRKMREGVVDDCYGVQVALAAFDRGYALGVTSR